MCFCVMSVAAGEHSGGVGRRRATAEADRPGLSAGGGRRCGQRHGAAAGSGAARVRAARVCAGPPTHARLGRLGRRRLPLCLPHWGRYPHIHSIHGTTAHIAIHHLTTYIVPYSFN